MHGFVDPPGMVCALFALQNGLCFHCNKSMIFLRGAGAPKGLLATREHIFPASSTGKFLHHNIVLAHSSCNNKRGDRAPTEDEINRTKELYKAMGVDPFIPDSVYVSESDFARKANERESYYKSKYKAGEFKFPTLADVWPKK